MAPRFIIPNQEPFGQLIHDRISCIIISFRNSDEAVSVTNSTQSSIINSVKSVMNQIISLWYIRLHLANGLGGLWSKKQSLWFV